ncbi:glycosyltransferase family 41 protein [Gonapodya prolifera JEL478]|uniref:protein O-GlcNAc transferase n=1 Tax=Gonapodya prolifera (strain JEL478) TaxID=1344416 RepID=A0A139A080_GONPJ|nr:glycosyltransferase family 41 protein [Gonapodya prolifera JEL478]|eukprot:KXS10170.1 glycosyltransferase family 41 protein [Gonapodya prolifera JEL478]
MDPRARDREAATRSSAFPLAAHRADATSSAHGANGRGVGIPGPDGATMVGFAPVAGSLAGQAMMGFQPNLRMPQQPPTPPIERGFINGGLHSRRTASGPDPVIINSLNPQLMVPTTRPGATLQPAMNTGAWEPSHALMVPGQAVGAYGVIGTAPFSGGMFPGIQLPFPSDPRHALSQTVQPQGIPIPHAGAALGFGPSLPHSHSPMQGILQHGLPSQGMLPNVGIPSSPSKFFHHPHQRPPPGVVYSLAQLHLASPPSAQAMVAPVMYQMPSVVQHQPVLVHTPYGGVYITSNGQIFHARDPSAAISSGVLASGALVHAVTAARALAEAQAQAIAASQSRAQAVVPAPIQMPQPVPEHGQPGPQGPNKEWFDYLLQTAHVKYNAGEYAATLSILQDLHAAYPTNLPTLLLLGCTCYSLGLHGLAVGYNERILGIDPNFAEAYSNLGTTFRAMAQGGGNGIVGGGWMGAQAGMLATTSATAGTLAHRSSAELLDTAEKCYRQAISIRPKYWDASINLAGMLSGLGRFREALEVYDEIERKMEEDFAEDERMCNVGVHVGQGQGVNVDDDRVLAATLIAAEKRRKHRAMMARAHGFVAPNENSGFTSSRRKDLYYAKGNLWYASGDVWAAKREYLKALVCVGLDVGAVYDSCTAGTLPAQTVTPAQALQMLHRKPGDPAGESLYSPTTSSTLQTLAKMYQDAQMPHLAVALYYISLSIHPTANTCNNLGILLSPQRLDESIAWYEVGLQLDPTHVHLYTNLGSALKDRGQTAEGINCYQRAIALQPDFYIALANLANVFKDLGRVDEAIDLYRRALRCKPDFVEAFCNYVNSLLFVCDWTDREENLRKISDVVNTQLREGKRTNPKQVPTVLPFHTFTYSSLSAYQVREISRRNAERVVWNVATSDWFPGFPTRPLKICRIAAAVSNGSTMEFLQAWSRLASSTGPVAALMANPSNISSLAVRSASYPYPYPVPPLPNPHIKIGYVSSDFNNHPLAHLMQSVFGLHSRNKFQVFCYSLTPSDDSPYRKKIEREAYKFVDLSSLGPKDIVERILNDGIHILVNLNGYTKGGRNEIFAARPAPLAMTYMGFAGTMGAGSVGDYEVEDDEVVAGNSHKLDDGDESDPDVAFFDGIADRWMDYFVADEVAAPRRVICDEPDNVEMLTMLQTGTLRRNKIWARDTNKVFTEFMVYMPQSYFVNDHRQGFREEDSSEIDRIVAENTSEQVTGHMDSGPTPAGSDDESHLSEQEKLRWRKEELRRLRMRAEVFPKVPEDTVIFANFNQLYKIDPMIFRTWCNILRRVPNSILWLLRFPPAGEHHLKQKAREYAGEEVAQRVVFTDVASKHVHIHRGRIADLFLDTPECNAHTTAADILWSGTPLVTFPKYEFKMCSRVAASIAYGTGLWPDAELPGMMEELVAIRRVEDSTWPSIWAEASRFADEKSKIVTGTSAVNDKDHWAEMDGLRQIRGGKSGRYERLRNPAHVGHLMVCTSYQEYEDRAVQFGSGVRWEWKAIGSWKNPRPDGTEPEIKEEASSASNLGVIPKQSSSNGKELGRGKLTLSTEVLRTPAAAHTHNVVHALGLGFSTSFFTPAGPSTHSKILSPFFPSNATPTHIFAPRGPLVRLRRRLFLTRDVMPLFDTGKWVRDLEKGILECWARWERGWAKLQERNRREMEEGGLSAPVRMDQGAATERKRRRRDSNTSEPLFVRGGYGVSGSQDHIIRRPISTRCIWIEEDSLSP